MGTNCIRCQASPNLTEKLQEQNKNSLHPPPQFPGCSHFITFSHQACSKCSVDVSYYFWRMLRKVGVQEERQGVQDL